MSPTPVRADAKAQKDTTAAARPVFVAIALAVVTILSIGHAFWSNGGPAGSRSWDEGGMTAIRQGELNELIAP
jgi:hypothetical protein